MIMSQSVSQRAAHRTGERVEGAVGHDVELLGAYIFVDTKRKSLKVVPKVFS